MEDEVSHALVFGTTMWRKDGFVTRIRATTHSLSFLHFIIVNHNMFVTYALVHYRVEYVSFIVHTCVPMGSLWRRLDAINLFAMA